MASKSKIQRVIALLSGEVPAPQQVSGKRDALDVLIATKLSQNTTDKTSYRAFENLKNDIGGWEDVRNAPIEKIRKAIRVCGLANQKAKSIKELLKRLDKDSGKLSLDYINKMSDEEIYDDLLRYDGIGLKTISCVLAFALGRDVFPVDTHVHRLCNRLGFVSTSTADKTFEEMKDKIPEGQKFLLHTLLIRFGRKVCRSNNPLCASCVLYKECAFPEKAYYRKTQAGSSMLPKENNFIILEHV